MCNVALLNHIATAYLFPIHIFINQLVGECMPPSTPISRSKTAALARVLDSIPKGYFRYVSGHVKSDKAERLVRKLHERHYIGATPAQRITRKKHAKANAILVMYWPENAEVVEWLMLFTAGELASHEQLCDVTDKRRRLGWLGYELVLHPNRGATSWTWRRPKPEMAEHYAVLADALKKKHYGVVSDHLARLANQPGFHGVREQSWSLCQYARMHGYLNELPYLFFVSKVNHGEKFAIL
jgi:hypothetical protein